ncbi:hypothetical protein BGX38DRAFT_1141916 [Terfezia claveryi]|nr:hypothetical protein BGX38DRAFT_1141916 [Terfezia claveryi]
MPAHGWRKKAAITIPETPQKKNAHAPKVPVSSLEEVLITSSVGSRKRKVAAPEVAEDKVESEEEEPVATVMQAKTISPIVHDDMRLDIINTRNAVNNTEEDIAGCLRYYAHVHLLVCRNLDNRTFVQIAQVMFGLSEIQVKEVTTGSASVREAFGILVMRHFRNYYAFVIGKLRDNFDCLLAMFWKCSAAKILIDAQIGVWNTNKVLNAMSKMAKVHNEMTVMI